MNALYDALLILAGILASAFFAGMETGLISLNRVRLRHEVERKNRHAIIINGFVENSERLLGTTLAGTNLANVLVAVFSSALVAQYFDAGLAVSLATTFVSAAVVLVLGEIVPKLLFRHYAHRLCMTCADTLNVMAWLFAPLVWTLSVLMRFIARVGRAAEQPRSPFVTRDELKMLAKEGEAGGALSAEERQMITGVFDFPYKTVFEVMVPLARTVTVARDTGVAELFDISQRTGFARFPVREGDKIIGVVNVYEIVFRDAGREGVTVERLMQKPPMVLSTERINRVLPVLRSNRQPISVVVNPEGQHVGIITIEDIVEEIVGDVEG
jgi:CBS domain containing-hemolysin-like protein